MKSSLNLTKSVSCLHFELVGELGIEDCCAREYYFGNKQVPLSVSIKFCYIPLRRLLSIMFCIIVS